MQRMLLVFAFSIAASAGMAEEKTMCSVDGTVDMYHKNGTLSLDCEKPITRAQAEKTVGVFLDGVGVTFHDLLTVKFMPWTGLGKEWTFFFESKGL